MLDSSLSSDVSFANIFSRSVSCLFIFLTVSFAEQFFLMLIKSSSPIISFLDVVS